MSAPAFAFESVCVEHGGVVILDCVTAAVPAGAITAITGPSGAGKSTLLRLCNRLVVPSSGVVRYLGDDVASLDPLRLRRRVGMVFQRPTLFAGTVRDNLAVARPDGDDELYGRALEAAALPAGFLGRDGGGLSGGEAQRACLARTLVTGPEALLMDEPTSSLDPESTALLERTALALAEGGTTIIWVTHDRAQVGRVATTVVELREGRVVA